MGKVYPGGGSSPERLYPTGSPPTEPTINASRVQSTGISKSSKPDGGDQQSTPTDSPPNIISRPSKHFESLVGFGVSQANAMVDKVATGKLSRADEAKVMMEFGTQIDGMSDNDLLEVAKKLTSAMRDSEGSDEVLGGMMKAVFDKMGKPDDLMSLINQKMPVDKVEKLKDLLGEKLGDSKVDGAKKLADDIMDIGNNGGDPAKLAEDVMAFQKSLDGMSEKQLLAVARYLGENMAEGPQKVDKIVSPLMMEVLNRMKQPESFLHQLKPAPPNWDHFPTPFPPHWQDGVTPMNEPQNQILEEMRQKLKAHTPDD